MVKPKLLEQVRFAIRSRHLSYRTEQAYVNWIRNFIVLTISDIRLRWMKPM